jgi:Domain of unknown function (DUF5979)
VTLTTDGPTSGVTSPANDTATLVLVNAYTDVPGSLVVQKTITGSAAGSQGAITIQVSCDDGAPQLADFDIPAGAQPGTVSQSYTGLPAGATCTANETGDGGTMTVVVVVTPGPQQTTVPAGDTAVISLRDAYSFKPPDLTVDTEVPADTPSGSDLPVDIKLDNVGKVAAKAVTVCLHLQKALAFRSTAGGRPVGNGACWRTVQIVRKAVQTFKPIARSYVRRAVVRACSGVTVEVRGVDLRKTKFCTYVLAAVKKQTPSAGVTG